MENKKPLAKCLAVLGTGSDVGKSVVVTALCRIFSNLGARVAPFKAQNMSNNSFVTLTGGEMGRAQIVQAEAARVEPQVDMNPVLLKPSSDIGSQVVLHGQPIGNREAKEYFRDTRDLFEQALISLERLRRSYDFIIIEGAGSCAEMNLRDRDFVNFRTAHAAQAPVILVADIDRGGVFAQIIGTVDLLLEEDRQQVKGFIINRFRGDPALFEDGIKYIEKRTGLPVLGLIPYFRHIEIDSEDGLPLEIVIDPPFEPAPARINIAVLRLPHISNFTDFFPLEREFLVNLHYLAKPRRLHGYHIVLIPGTKNVRWDMEWLRENGWDHLLSEYIETGGEIGGICGGYQMLGQVIRDPHGIEGTPGETLGLSLLNTVTTLQPKKILCRSSGVWNENGELVEGYEIHMGITARPEKMRAPIRVKSRNGITVGDYDGAMRVDGKVWGTYFHGLFDTPGFRQAFLKRLRPDLVSDQSNREVGFISAFKDHQYELLADHFQKHLNISRLLDIIGAEDLGIKFP